MGLRIRTNVASLKAQRNFGLNSEAQTSSMEKLSSGYRINKSADDAAGLAITDTLLSKIRSADQARRNANDGVSLIQVAEGSFNEVTNMLIRLRELATQAASDTIGNTERSYANKEYIQLVDEIDRISNSTEFNGMKLLQGAEGNGGVGELSVHVGIGGDSENNIDAIKVNIEDIKMGTVFLGLSKESEIGPIESGIEFSRSTAAEKLTTIDVALKTIAGSRAVLGAKQSRLTSAVNNLGVQIENMNSSRSRIKDVDFASESANLTQQSILSQAGAAILTQTNQLPQLALTLLRQ